MMQMQKIKRLCLSRSEFAIVNGGTQWLGDGLALFAVPGDVNINADMLAAMFDLTEKQVRECQWSTRPEEELDAGGINLADNADVEVMLHELPASVTVAGTELKMLYSADGKIALAADQAEFSPIEKYTEARFYARRFGNGWAIAVKNGYALVAYIMPWQIQGNAISDTILQMRDVLGMMITGARREVTADVDGVEILRSLKATFGEGSGIDTETGEVVE